jgi:hypothetical protein
MVRYRIFTLALILGFAIGSAAAQTPVSSPEPQKQHIVPVGAPPRERLVPARPEPGANAPFAFDGVSSSIVEVRPASALSEPDKILEANAESTIREHASMQALDFASGQWSYSELACRSFPRHLFLRFNRNNGAGDESAFTISIPRDGTGHIRFIPLLRRGYSLWSPTPVNAITISAFNHILAEEQPEGLEGLTKPQATSMSVCYAALAGSGGPEAQSVELAEPLLAHLSVDGPSSVVFITAGSHPHQWEMIFDRKGRLTKATHNAFHGQQMRVVKDQTVSGGKVPAEQGNGTTQTVPAGSPPAANGEPKPQ